MLKRFMIFAFDTYYPSGGMEDYLESFDSIPDVKQYITLIQKKYTYDNIVVYDQMYEKEVELW